MGGGGLIDFAYIIKLTMRRALDAEQFHHAIGAVIIMTGIAKPERSLTRVESLETRRENMARYR